MNTSRIWHQKREVSNWSDCTQNASKCCFGAKITSKQRDFQSACARNMAFCWQVICSKPNLVNMLLFHDTIHQTHPNPFKICHLQRLLRFHGTSPGIWTSQPPFEIWIESSLFLTSQYDLMVSMDSKIQSNISVFVTNPWNPSNSIKVLISTSHPDLRGVAAYSGLRGPDFGLNAKSSDEGMFLPTARKPGQRFYVFLLSKSECFAMDCFGTYSNTCPNLNVTRVQNATQWTASVHTLTHARTLM